MKNNPTRIHVYDFDGTLVYSPTPDRLIDGVPAIEHYDRWLADNGMPKRKFIGWWGRKETLLPPIFGTWIDGKLAPPPEDLNVELADIVRDHGQDEESLLLLMTGRHVKMTHTYDGVKQHVCRTILDAYGLKFDRYHYSIGQSTIKYKIEVIQLYLEEFPGIRYIEIWEDRAPHISEFWNFINCYKKLGKLDEGKVHFVEERISAA